MDTLARLTPEQDGVLRRLTFFERSGMLLSPPYWALRADLRALDRRAVVRDPWESWVPRTG